MAENKVKTVTVKKLYNGFASVRDYLVDDCITSQRDLLIKYNTDKMIVPLEQVKQKFRLHHQSFESKFNNKPYGLIDFLWRNYGKG